MGIAATSQWTELDPAKTYLVEVDNHWDVIPGPGDCTNTFLYRCQCCRPGAEIIAWLAAGNECKRLAGICPGSAWAAQKLINITGPYDNVPACELDIERVCGV